MGDRSLQEGRHSLEERHSRVVVALCRPLVERSSLQHTRQYSEGIGQHVKPQSSDYCWHLQLQRYQQVLFARPAAVPAQKLPPLALLLPWLPLLLLLVPVLLLPHLHHLGAGEGGHLQAKVVLVEEVLVPAPAGLLHTAVSTAAVPSKPGHKTAGDSMRYSRSSRGRSSPQEGMPHTAVPFLGARAKVLISTRP